MYSFYGGKQGRTYNIVQRYDSIQKMIEAFSNGGAYTQANYGQYVIIDTPNKNNPQNGILYRRGFDYTQQPEDRPSRTIIDSETGESILNPEFWTITDTDQNFDQEKWNTAWLNYIKQPGSGAIYVGQIVGPEGQAPDIQGMSWEQFIAQTDKQIHSYDLSYTPGAEVRYEQELTEQGDIETKRVEQYNDVMQSGNCTIRDENDNVIGAYISFNIPSTIFKFSGIDISPYGDTIIHKDYVSEQEEEWTVEAQRDDQTGQLTGKYTNLIHQHYQSGPKENATIIEFDEETGEETVVKNPNHHPFYYDFQIAVPRGKQGKSITEFKIESNIDIGSYQAKGEQEPSLHTDMYGYILDENGSQILDSNGNPIQVYEIDQNGSQVIDEQGFATYNKDKYLTYTSIDYSQSAEGVETTHLGRWPYRVIDEISLQYNPRNIITAENWSSLETVEVNDLFFIREEEIEQEESGSDEPIIISDEGEQVSTSLIQDSIKISIYAVCIKPGYINPDPNFSPVDLEAIAQDGIINYDDSSWIDQEGVEHRISPGEGSQWRIQRIPQTAAAASLRVNYTQGTDAFFENKLRNVEYVTLDKQNNLYVVYSDGPNTPLLVGNLGKGILNILPIDRQREYYIPYIIEDDNKIWNINSPQEGQVYSFSNQYYAVCIKTGSLNQTDFPEIDSNNPPKAGTVFTVGQSSWRFIELPEASISQIRVNYTDESSEELPFKQVDFIYTDDKGNLYVKYSDSNENYFLTTIDSIKDIKSENGYLIITYNSDRQTTKLPMLTNFEVTMDNTNSQIVITYYNGNNGVQQRRNLPVKQVNTITYTNQKDITQAQKFEVTYQGQFANTNYSSDAINSILDVKRIGDNVVVLYSDPNYRTLISQGKTEGLDYYLIPWTDPVTGTIYDTNSEVEGHKSTLVWKNLGALGAQYHVAGHYQITDLINNGKLINGFIGDEKDKAGWIVSVTNPATGDKVLYAYDYNDPTNKHTITYNDQTYNTNWYVIKNFEDSLLDISQHLIIDQDVDSNPKSQTEQIAGDIWFVLSKGHDNY